ISGGRRAGLAAMAGAMTGCCVHTVLAAIGLSALLAASTTAFTILKIVGAFYLLWMAYDAIRNGSALSVKPGAPRRDSFWRTYMIGIGINLTNPKIVLFFVTFLPQFVAAGDPHASQKLVFLGLYFIAFSAPLAALLVLGAERVISLLKGNPKVLRGIDYAFGGLFATFALKILATGGR
ncbi:MAG TPA: LysE family translocator, partial [Saliniramus sp.]|nr:LysE family translocator [Saliniramus sp.]